MNGPSSVALKVPYHKAPLAELAARIIADHKDSIPDLSHITILIPDNSAARQLRREILSAAALLDHRALLGPHTLSLREWVQQFLPEGLQLCDDQSRELQLVEALLGQNELLGQANPWALAENLIQLFDELTLNQIQLPDSLEDFSQQLAQAYQLVDTSLTPFSHEAKIVHTLWQAWQQQLKDRQQIDTSLAYVLALNQALQKLEDQYLYLAGYDFLSRAEQDWQDTLVQQGSGLFLQSVPDTAEQGDSHYRSCLDSVYMVEGDSLLHRARELASLVSSSPLEQTLSVFNANNHEEEARAVDIQVRQWLLAGRQSIGIVTENRRLARRVRALLERADIQLEDASGWALSTTSAAASLEALLQCLEEDFSYIPFLDLVKSPLIFHDLERNRVEMSVYRLEQDIIRHENIARGLGRYRRQLLHRQQRLPDWMPEVSPTLLSILDRLDEVATHFQRLLSGQHPAREYLAALLASLDILGIEPALSSDAAGQRIMQTLNKMCNSADNVPVKISWLDFRSWLGRQLELANFKPADTGSPVQLMGLAQSNLQHFDCLIIASAEAEFMPGQDRGSPFFNQAVRKELGLATASEHRNLRFRYYRRLLESADKVLITLRSEQDGEPVNPSPWLAQLQAFHNLAWGTELHANELKQIVASPDSLVVRCDDAPLAEPARQPGPVIPAANLPDTISASDYQLLMDCPYHFFAARCLKLAAPDNIREELARADYGQRVHRCLEAFHSGVANLPGPFGQELNDSNRQQAIGLLNEIAITQFADDLASNFAHRAWLQLWQSVIPEYIDWQIRRESTWQVSQSEVKSEHELQPSLKVKGRLDRIDRNDKGLAIVDYKTGTAASKNDVEKGEAVQLPFYALLSKADNKTVSRVEYLKLDRPGNVGSGAALEGEQLDEMLVLTEQRLIEIMQQIQEGEGLPAWADEKTCNWCDMQTLCRRQVWEDR